MAMGLNSSGRKRGRSSRRAPMAEINVTPFVDVMLVLLIIFMITAPMLASGVPVDLPESRANPMEQDVDQVTVSIDESGFIYVDETLIEAGEFPVALEQLASTRSTAEMPVVTLRADRGLDYGRVMAVMGELNRSGFNQVTLVTSGSSEAP
ncbi:protein TolR [Altererythrobacter sp. KTW20L]|uniref:protein TolR n=1 Tax=Altererythrobacter sp. KTW20L TaxID=2942210 RepID=UPI0020BE81A2|nr:protein TolR [Altererythrobacter sp. KTW20L]MCL6250537.1 protein TolR [Altererythrobacter sp. KTW20L]